MAVAAAEGSGVTVAVFRPSSAFSVRCEYCDGPREPTRLAYAGKPLYRPCYCIFRLEAN